MKSEQQICEHRRVKAFLSEQLSMTEEEAFVDHLVECQKCRTAVEQLAATPGLWHEARELLKPTMFDQSANNAKKIPLQVRNVLALLDPTDDPRMLGRLGGYEVSGVVGAGGMGIVLKAIDRSLDRTVAIKVLSPHLATSGPARHRFAREAKAAAGILHPNVIAIHSVSNRGALPWLVMPYICGDSLEHRIENEWPLPIEEILRIGSQIASGLAAAHLQGLVHRDIKPANILIERGIERSTITDFGLARAVDDATMTRSGIIAGTPQYMSPEQARGESLDGRSDLFSLGSVLYAMCTAHSPFRAETPYGVIERINNDTPRPIQESNPRIPVWFDGFVRKLMAKDPRDRFGSSKEVAELLEAFLGHVQQPTRNPLPRICRNLEKLSLQVRSKSTPQYWRTRVGKSLVAAISLGVIGFVFWQSATHSGLLSNLQENSEKRPVKSRSDSEKVGDSNASRKVAPSLDNSHSGRSDAQERGQKRPIVDASSRRDEAEDSQNPPGNNRKQVIFGHRADAVPSIENSVQESDQTRRSHRQDSDAQDIVDNKADAIAPPRQSSEDIIHKLTGLKRPIFDPARGGDKGYVDQYQSKMKVFEQRQMRLTLELYETNPGHSRLLELMPQRWDSLIRLKQFETLRRETSEVINTAKLLQTEASSSFAVEAAFAQAASLGVEHNYDVDLFLPAIEQLVVLSPHDERIPSLLLQAAQYGTEGKNLKRKLLNRILSQYPDSFYATSVPGKLRQLDNIGKPFELEFVDAVSGKDVSIKSLLGKIVVVDFWATWCGPCVAAMPKHKELYAKYKESGVEFIGISLDKPKERGGRKALLEFCQSNEISWPQYYQGDKYDSEFSRSWGINSIPVVFIIDQAGNLYSVNARENLEQTIKELIANGQN